MGMRLEIGWDHIIYRKVACRVWNSLVIPESSSVKHLYRNQRTLCLYSLSDTLFHGSVTGIVEQIEIWEMCREQGSPRARSCDEATAQKTTLFVKLWSSKIIKRWTRSLARKHRRQRQSDFDHSRCCTHLFGAEVLGALHYAQACAANHSPL